MKHAMTNIGKVVDQVYYLACNSLPTTLRRRSVVRLRSPEALQNVKLEQYERAVMIFPVEDVGREIDQISLMMLSRGTDRSLQFKQLLFLPASAGGMVNYPLGSADRRTPEQMARIVTDFIRTGDMRAQ